MNKKNSNLIFSFLCALALVFSLTPYKSFAQELLTPEETLWLQSRNNTLVVYPEKGFPPFSYQSSSGTPQGLSIDYIELIAEKIGAKIEYLPARSRFQILEDIKNGKGDLITAIASTKEKETSLYFTDNYITISTVIVVRKDFNEKKVLTVADLTGKKVAVGEGYALAEFLNKNYPRIILEKVTDDEVGLQQLVLGEVDVAVMDIASLSFYLSKQVLSSVKIVGSVGFDYNLGFAVPKDKEILQAILDKGLSQISKTDREILNEKWISVPNQEDNTSLRALLKHSVTRENIYI